MRIGITCHTSAGGSGILATELGIAMAERGHEVHFVTHEPPFRLREYYPNVYSHYAQTVTYDLFASPPYTLALTTKMAEVAEEHKIELWHVHYAIPYAACAIQARDMLAPEDRYKLVTTLHGTDITLVGSDPSYHRITKYAMEQSDAVTTVSNWLNEETQRTFNLSRPIRTIYNFVNDSLFDQKKQGRRRLASPDEKIIMHISNFRPVKRVTDVVRTFKKVLDHVNARLIMVGDGPERLSAVGVARQLGISDRIKYVGSHEHIENLLASADLIFQPSEHESFGLVPLEAMASQVPVLGTASGGVTEVVIHGETGYLADVGDIETMARYAVELLSDEAKAKAMGRRGREIALEKFSRERIVSEYEALYNELAGVAAPVK